MRPILSHQELEIDGERRHKTNDTLQGCCQSGWMVNKLRQLIGQLSTCWLLLDGWFIGGQSDELHGSFAGLSGSTNSFAD